MKKIIEELKQFLPALNYSGKSVMYDNYNEKKTIEVSLNYTIIISIEITDNLDLDEIKTKIATSLVKMYISDKCTGCKNWGAGPSDR